MDSRKMGVVVLLMMFVVIGAALSDGSSNANRQSVSTDNGSVAMSGDRVVANAENRMSHQFDPN